MSSRIDTPRGRPKSGPCLWCVAFFKWIPVLFIVAIVLWSYYAYVIQLCFVIIQNNFQKAIYLICYHILFIIFCWAYWQTIFTDIGTVPSQFKLPKTELENLERAENEEVQRLILEKFARDLPVTNRTINGAIRYCDKCQHVKPDRAHHCSVCGECVLKMDHHCPWVNNCVSFTNYKFFILFLGYALLYCLFIALTSLSYFIGFWKGEIEGIAKFHILFLFFVALMFAISLISLFLYHCYLVMKNRSTLEAFRAPIFRSGPDKDGFSLGRYNNFQEVFGDHRLSWFLPIFTSLGDGVAFPVRAQHASCYDSMGRTHNSLGDGVIYPQRALDEEAHTLLGGGRGQRWSDEPSDVEPSATLSGLADPMAATATTTHFPLMSATLTAAQQV